MRKLTAAQKRKAKKNAALAAIFLSLAGGGVYTSRIIDAEWTQGLAPIKALESRVDKLEKSLAPEGPHEHVYPKQWSNPVRMEGNYVNPVFVQTKACRICGSAVARMVN